MTETAVETQNTETAVATRTHEQRKEALATAVANSVREGWGVALLGGEKHRVIHVDEYDNVNVQG